MKCLTNSYLHKNCTNHISRSITSFGTTAPSGLKKNKSFGDNHCLHHQEADTRPYWLYPPHSQQQQQHLNTLGQTPGEISLLRYDIFNGRLSSFFCSNSIWRCNSEKNPEAHSRCCGLPPRDCSTVGRSYQRSEKYVVPPSVLCRNYTINKYDPWWCRPRCPTMHV